jgi:hypothetical protein
MILVAVLLVYIHFMVMGPMFDAAKALDASLGVFEPFLAICSDNLIMLLFPIFFTVLMADYPRTEADTIFRVSRIGRKNWLFGQIGMLILSSLAFVGSIFFACCMISLLQGGKLMLSWESAVMYSANHVIQIGSMVNFIPSNIYYQVTQPQAIGYSLLLLFLNCILTGMILMTATLCNMKKMGFALSAGSTMIGATLAKLNTSAQWIFPAAHFILKQHFTAYFSKPIFPVWGSVLYDLGISVLLLIVSIYKVSSYHFIVHGEEMV